MKKILFRPYNVSVQIAVALLCLLIVGAAGVPTRAAAQQAPTPPQPLVAIHVSELTQTLDTAPAAWHYFVAYESLKEALRSDGTPFIVVSDGDIAAGKLHNSDGSPKYPILISLAADAIADNEISQLRDYVNTGGFLLVGSSAFTLRQDGSSRGDFALASEMGLHVANSNLNDWYLNNQFTKTADHRLTSHIPSGTLAWYGPLNADEIPWGVSPSHALHSNQYAWQVVANGATVIANGDAGPLLAVKSYGQGQFIYHGAFQPLIGHGGYDPGMYEYLIYRKAIEWAFESFSLPIFKVSPWPYQYDAAFVVRHDFENNQTSIKSIESSAQFEYSLGAKGDYYFSTGALRADMGGDAATVSSLKRAVSNYGATIGSHNGGLKNPVNTSLSQLDYDYWHWGPDEALDSSTTGTYANGKAYAKASISASFKDIEGWLSGKDNGRAGCGAAGTCPRTWVGPYFNSTREDSYDILAQLGSITMGEQKISPFPHWTMSYQTSGKRYSHVTLPPSDWYVGASIAQGIDDAYAYYFHTTDSIRAAVDFYYDLGALINFYVHTPSNDGTVGQEYVTYSMSKPKLWSTNAVGVYDWWSVRSNVVVNPSFTMIGDIAVSNATIAGSTDANSAVEIVIPNWGNLDQGTIEVLRNGTPANSSNYRVTDYGVKVEVGTTISSVEVDYTPEALSTISVSPATVVGGNSSTGTITLTLAAPIYGKAVSLSSNNASASVPATVTVPGLSTSATFAITTSAVASSTPVTISATSNGVTKNAALTIEVAPTVTAFAATSLLSNWNIPITSFAASGGIGGVKGYRVTTSAVPPLASAGGWTGTPPTSYSVSSDGTYVLYPWVKDSTDTVSAVYGSPVTVIVDTVAPNAPSVSGTTPTNNTTPTWNWSSGGGGGNSIYRYKLDDSNLGSGSTTTTGTSYTPASALTSNATHTFYVQERDAAGNWSNSGSFAIVIDTVAPNAPSVLGTTPTNSTTPTWNWSSGGGGGNGIYRYKLDDSNLSSGSSTTTGTSYTPASALTSNATHTFYVQERDAAGNWSNSGSFAVLIDITIPNAPSVSGTTPTNNTTPTWHWSSGGGGGNGTYRYKLDDSNLNSGSTMTTGTRYTPGSALMSNSTRTFYVQERNVAGTWSASGSFAILIDTTAPTASISAPSSTVGNSSTPATYTVTYTGADTITLASGDVTLNRTGTANGTAAVSGTGTGTRTITISNITGYGTIGISIAGGTAGDLAGNRAPAAGPSTIFTADNNSGADMIDALKALRFAVGLDAPTSLDIAHWDVAPLVSGIPSPDGKIDLADVVALLRKAAGLSSW